jgi:hypothetical protein
MDKFAPLLHPSARHTMPTLRVGSICSDAQVHIEDKRVARLLLVLHELDRSVAGLEELPQPELSELVASAILACGFTDGTDARYAIAAVLCAIERRDPSSESS